MNRLKLFFVAMALFFVACNEKIEMSLDQTSVELTAEGGEATVNLTSNGDWAVDECPDWIEMSSLSGSGAAVLKLIVSGNYSNEERMGVVQISTKDAEGQIAVTQGFFTEPVLTVEPTLITVKPVGDTVSVVVSSNTSWTLDCPNLWISPSDTAGVGSATVTLVISPNNIGDTTPRTAVLTFLSGELSARVTIMQGNDNTPAIIVAPSSIEASWRGGEQVVSVVCSTSWSLTCPEWITPSVEEGEGNAEVKFGISENETFESREGNMNFTSGMNVVFVHIVQEGAPNPHFLEVDPMEVNFSNEGGLVDISVSCDAEWNVACSADWLSISNVEGPENNSFRIHAAENPYNTQRADRVTVTSGELRKVITVMQDAGELIPSLVVSPDSVYTSYFDTIFFVTVTSNGPWTVTSTEWALASVGSGENDGTFRIALSKNTSQRPRYCDVTVTFGNIRETIYIYQNAKPVPYLTLDLTEINAPAEGGRYEINVSSNADWTVRCAEWMTVSPDSGLNNGTILVTLPANVTPFDRRGEVVVSVDDDHVSKVQIIQEGQTK